jgi:long-chain fatty acid transport protein
MRNLLLVLFVCALTSVSAEAQNTDIESLAGLQFNFGNPGARSLGMGGAFLGLADDASATEANPAGLTILRKTEISIEGRNYAEQQVFTTSGTFPDLNRTAFSHFSNSVEVTFASLVYPIRNFTIGAYYHQPLRNVGAGRDVDIHDNLLAGPPTLSVPDFYLPREPGPPISKAECEARRANDSFACFYGPLFPFVSAVDVQERTFGIAGAYKFGDLSVGATARYQRFRETAFTFRLDDTFSRLQSVVVQATSDIRKNNQKAKYRNDLTFAAGVKWAPTSRISVGAVYKQGAKFQAPWFAATEDTNFEFVKGFDTTFHIPDIYGIGASVRPIPVLTVNADLVRVTYSNLVDEFLSINQAIRDLGSPYQANDVTEIHLGAEYFFSTRVPFAVRAGAWRDPAHSIEFRGPLDVGDVNARAQAVASAILYPKGTSRNHLSIGAGFAWPRFQIDAAYDRSENYRVGSISAVTRF